MNCILSSCKVVSVLIECQQKLYSFIYVSSDSIANSTLLQVVLIEAHGSLGQFTNERNISYTNKAFDLNYVSF
jgi:hypothetical protein